MANVVQRSFSAGEVSPSIYPKTDFAKYSSALRTLRNTFITRHGSANNRPGTMFVGEVKDSTKKVRLVPFVFNNDQTYILEFGNLYLRIIKDGAHVTLAGKNITAITKANPGVVTSASHGYVTGEEVYISGVGGMTELNNRNFKVTNLTANTYSLQKMDGTNLDTSGYTTYTSGGTSYEIYTITTNYTEAQLPDLRLIQSADIITITHPSHPPRELARTSDTSWAFNDIEFFPSQDEPTFLAATAGGAGANTYIYTVTAVNLETGEESLRGTGSSSVSIDVGISTANPGVVSATAHGLLDGERVLIEGVVGMIEVNNREFVVSNKTANTFELLGIDTTNYTAYASGGTITAKFVKLASAAAPTSSAPHVISWTGIADADVEYNIYRSTNGIFGLIGIASGESFNDVGTTPDTTKTAPYYRNPFVEEDDYPTTCAYYQERLFFANSTNNSEGIWGSKTGNYKNFSVSSPIQDDDAVTFTIAGRQVNSVKHMIDLGNLIVFTRGGEWSVTGGASGVITPSSIGARQYSYNGSSDLAPIIINNTAIYVQERGSIVRDLAFDFNTDGYSGNDLTVLSSHLVEGYTIVDWAFQKVPNSVLWCVRDDGALLALTYMPEQELFAWHRHDFGNDLVENVCVIPEDNEDVLYLTIYRTIGSASYRYIERMSTRQVHDRYMVGFTDRRDFQFLDCNLSYDGRNSSATTMTLSGGSTWAYDEDLTLTASSSTFVSTDIGNEIHLYIIDTLSNITDTLRCEITAYTSATVVTIRAHKTVPAALRSTATTNWAEAVDQVTGLWHLEGMDVSVLGDSFVVASPNNATYTTITVTNGIATLDRPYSVIHVGLPYISDIETLNIDTVNGQSVMADSKLVNNVCIYTEKTRGVWVGAKPPTDDDDDPLEGLRQFKIRNSENYDSPVRLVSDPMEINIKGEWNNNGRVFIRQVDPVPMSVLAIVPSGTIPFRG